MNIDPSKSSRRRVRRANADNEKRLARDAAVEGAEHVEVLVDDLFVEELDVPLALPHQAAPAALLGGTMHAGHDVFVTPAAPLPPEAPPVALAPEHVLAAKPSGLPTRATLLRRPLGIEPRSLVGMGILGGAVVLAIGGIFAAARARTNLGWRRWAA